MRGSMHGAWVAISAAEYRAAFDAFGGSLAVHPRVVDLLESLSKQPVAYAGFMRGGECLAAVPLWGEHIVAARSTLWHYKQLEVMDIGSDSEMVFPIAASERITVPFHADCISPAIAAQVQNAELDTTHTLMLAKGIATGGVRHSSQSAAKRRREQRRIVDAGGRFVPFADLSGAEIAQAYIALFKKRWAFDPMGHALLPRVFGELKDMLWGSLLLIRDQPVAINIIYRHETPRWLFANGINQGVDPDFLGHSPGSVLMFLNLAELEQDAMRLGKELRYCFGGKDAAYKALWSYEAPAYKVSPAAEVGDQPAGSELARA